MTIVTVAGVLLRKPFTTPLKSTENCSVASPVMSLTIGIAADSVSTPGEKYNVSDTVYWSVFALAVPGVVVSCTSTSSWGQAPISQRDTPIEDTCDANRSDGALSPEWADQ